MRSTRLVAGSLTLLLAAGCGGSTQLTNVWANPQWSGTPIDNVMIIGVTQREAVRRNFEQHFIDLLADRGITAISSAAVLPPGRLDSTTVAEYVQRHQVDAILVTRLIGVDQETQYVPGRTYAVSSPYYGYGGFYGYYYHSYDLIYTPGYYQQYEVIKLETNVYERDKSLIWAAVSETFSPGSEDEVIQSLGRAVMKDLDQRGMLGDG